MQTLVEKGITHADQLTPAATAKRSAVASAA